MPHTLSSVGERSRRCGPRCGLSAMLACAALSIAGPTFAQEWPAGTLAIADGRVTVGGEVLLTAATEDRGSFNTTEYERNAARLLRLGIVSAFRATDRLALVLELRAEGDSADGHWGAGTYAAYVSVRPTGGAALELQAGRIAGAFGGFMRRAYGSDNLLIGYPLAYQYLTSLRQDTVPRSADELLGMRGHGAYVSYGGSSAYAAGVPLATVFRYDTGVLARARPAGDRLELLGSLTVGSLSHPGADGNGTPQAAARLVWRPVPGFAAGGSVSRGGFLHDRASASLSGFAPDRTSYQRAAGADVEYSRDYWLLRSEVLSSSWDVPSMSAPGSPGVLRATSWLVEGRYTVAPGVYVAARFDTLWFSELGGTYERTGWDANVWRAEGGVGYALARHVRLKFAVQHSRRDGGAVPRQTLGAVQAVVWF